MTPSQAMGLFLRTWRAEWAKLTRAQLARLLGSELHRREAVTVASIRQWESGQPPKDLTELDALGAVMRSHALSAHEVQEFRDAVFAACLDRHYPGLLGGGNFAHQRDVDAVAAELFATNWMQSHYAHPVSIVAAIAELEQALGAEGRGASRVQTQRQRIALAYLVHGLDRHHGHYGRYVAERDSAAPLASFVARHFGPRGFDERLSVPALQLVGTFSAASAERAAGGPGHAARRLLALSEEALAQGDTFAGVEAFGAALLHPTAFDPKEYRLLIARGELLVPHMEGVHVPGVQSETWWTPHSSLTLAALRAGDLPRAARHFETLLAHTDAGLAARIHLGECGALLAWQTGDRTEALACLRSLLDLLRAEGDEAYAEGVRQRIAACNAGEPAPVPLAHA
ncbi:MAG: helix-turn-helix transcriptional regulator [Armatimonadetes bacterium]|nr:helix-turn-helix transcriptional regulator [Armatimonadota bacterium]